MRPVEAIKTCLAKSFQFSGRASRSEFWLFGLFCTVIFHYAFVGEYFFWGTGWLTEADISLQTLAKMHSFANAASRLEDFVTVPIGYKHDTHAVGYAGTGNIWMGNWTFLFRPTPYLRAILFLILVFPTLSVATRRARDAGWNPVLTMMLWLWPMALLLISNSAVVIITALQSGQPNALVTGYTQNVIGPFMAFVAPILGEMTALIPVYIFALPSISTPRPNPLEAQS